MNELPAPRANGVDAIQSIGESSGALRKGNMNQTKNDLSYDSTSLDWQALEKSVTIAYSSLLNQIRTSSEKMHNTLVNEGAADYQEAAIMDSLIKQLVVVAETYHTIQGANYRRKLEIVNKATELAFDEEEKTQ